MQTAGLALELALSPRSLDLLLDSKHLEDQDDSVSDNEYPSAYVCLLKRNGKKDMKCAGISYQERSHSH